MVAVTSLLSCGSSDPGAPPSSAPAYEGTVTEIGPDELTLEHDQDGCGLVSLKRDSETIVLRQIATGSYEPITWNDLKPDQRASIWIGDEDLSCPTETIAQTVLVTEP